VWGAVVGAYRPSFGFRDHDGKPHLDAHTLSNERVLVETVLSAGQAEGRLAAFSPRVIAVTLKAALDGLLAQLALDPDLDLDTYADELVTLFERATKRPDDALRSQPSATNPTKRR
jgi:TetR/AcrR family transcriptional regulator, fatty acid metabolism regulator protein